MAANESGACVEAGAGGVGESGASSQVIHQVTGKVSKMMVVKTVDTSLCPNTGAIAVLIVNGTPAAHGSITANGSSIQAEASPSDWVIAIVHTVPLFNEIACVRLGELSFHLHECDLVT